MSVLKGGILLKSEEATGTVDGSNTAFTTSFLFVPTTLIVYWNGIELKNPDDFTETGTNSFTLTIPPVGGIDPDRITVLYQRA